MIFYYYSYYELLAKSTKNQATWQLEIKLFGRNKLIHTVLYIVDFEYLLFIGLFRMFNFV